MDKTLIWLLVPGALVIFAFLRVSARYQHKCYDLEEFFLAGKHLTNGRFVLAATTVSFLGLMVLSHMGLFYRSGFSYGFTALAAIIVPLVSAFFARRLWILGRIFNPLTPAQLLGDYYRSSAVREITALVAVLVAMCLTIMSLRFGASLVEGLLGGISLKAGSSRFAAPLTMIVMAALLFIHASFGGMGAIVRIAAPVGIALVIALVLIALVLLNTLGGFSGFFDHLARLQVDEITAPLFRQGVFFDPAPAAAPTNMAWPGAMVASALIALAGLASAPTSLMLSFTPTKGRSHAHQQFLAAALMTGFVLLTTTILIALVARLAGDVPGLATELQSTLAPLKAGSEPQAIILLLLATPLGTPLLVGLITLALLCGLLASSAAALITAGAMISHDVFFERLKRANQPTYRRSVTRYTIGAILVFSLVLSWSKPEDPLPLFLLAGAFGLQLLPALAGLCYFPSLTGKAVHHGMLVGILFVIATSSIPQGLAGLLSLPLPFDAWPLSLHPALWGLATNLAVLLFASFARSASMQNEHQKQSLAHQQSYHVLPDGQPLMAPDAKKWRLIAALIGICFAGLAIFPLTGISLPKILPDAVPALWSWQFLSWLVGLALVYVVAYRLQPVFDPEQAMDGSFNPQRRRFRVKAQSRQTKGPAHTSEVSQHDNEKK